MNWLLKLYQLQTALWLLLLTGAWSGLDICFSKSINSGLSYVLQFVWFNTLVILAMKLCEQCVSEAKR